MFSLDDNLKSENKFDKVVGSKIIFFIKGQIKITSFSGSTDNVLQFLSGKNKDGPPTTYLY